MAATTESRQLSDAIIAFSLDGRFPDDATSLPAVSDTDLQPAIESLANTKIELEQEIHQINAETKEDVSSWVQNAKTLQEDIIRSKTIANDIVRQSEAPDVSGEAIEDAEEKAEFLNREVQYSQQLHGVLSKIRDVNQLLAEVEQARNERRVLESLQLLEQSWTALDQVGVSKSSRILKLLDHRAFELKGSIHEVFNQVWTDLIYTSVEEGKVAIHGSLNDGGITLSDAVIGLKAYKEVDERMEQLWRNVDAAIVSPRMEKERQNRPSVATDGEELKLTGRSDDSIDALLTDLETVVTFLAQQLQEDLLAKLCPFMMADLIPKLIQKWLHPAVPTSLADIPTFQDIIQRAQVFCETLRNNGFSGFDDLSEWVNKAHMTWLGKCRETALNTVRSRLTSGIGKPKEVEKIEKRMVTVSEGRELATTGAGAAADTNDWGDAWDDAWDDDNQETQMPPMKDENEASEATPATTEDDGTDAWGWDDDGDQPAAGVGTAQGEDDDAGADAWGWGEEDTTTGEAPAPKPSSPRKTRSKPPTREPVEEEQRELILKESYHISSMPEPVLELLFAILEDGAALTKENSEYSLVAATAPGLFSLPTFVLALFRAISPYYYSLDVGGNMFLYNDAMYMAEKLSGFSDAWKDREDLTQKAKTMLRLDNDIKTLQNFANRSYSNEMSIQKTILQDLTGGTQSLMQLDDTESSIEAGTARIRLMETTWEPILARSVLSQAIGSLVDALSTRIISDVLDMSSIGQEESTNIANWIGIATTLDDLFLPSKLGGTEPVEDEVAVTQQYAPTWLRLQYLGELLRSNLNDVKFLWCEGKLSMDFTVDEVVDLIEASFEDNARTRETIKEIRSRPQPWLEMED